MYNNEISSERSKEQLIPIIAQDAKTGIVRMVGVGNGESIQVSDKTGNLTFWSRTKGRLWTKGEESRDVLQICEKIPLSSSLVGKTQTALVYKVSQIIGKTGMTCHTGAPTCFYKPAFGVSEIDTLDQLDYEKMNGKILVLVQDAATLDVTLAGILGQEEFVKLIGEYDKQSPGLLRFQIDCDNDTVLIQV